MEVVAAAMAAAARIAPPEPATGKTAAMAVVTAVVTALMLVGPGAVGAAATPSTHSDPRGFVLLEPPFL